MQLEPVTPAELRCAADHLYVQGDMRLPGPDVSHSETQRLNDLRSKLRLWADLIESVPADEGK